LIFLRDDADFNDDDELNSLREKRLAEMKYQYPKRLQSNSLPLPSFTNKQENNNNKQQQLQQTTTTNNNKQQTKQLTYNKLFLTSKDQDKEKNF
jgi:hypothetical protein